MKSKQKTRQELLADNETLKAEIKLLRETLSNPVPPPPVNEGRSGQSSDILQTILENSIPVIFMIDQNGVFTISEGKDLKTLGLKPGEVVGVSAFELYKDYPDILHGIKEAMAGNHIRVEVVVADEVFDVFYSPFHDNQGNISGVLGMAVNVTERVEALKRLRLLTEMVEQSSDSIIFTDTDFKISYINYAAKRLYGWSLEELQGKSPDRFNAEPLRDEYQQGIYKTISKGHTFTGEALNIRKDGSTFICDMKVSAITDSDGKITGYMSLQRDITERDQMISEIISSQSKYWALMNQANDAIFIAEAGTGQLLDANQKAQELIGWTLEEIKQMHQSELHPPKEQEHYRNTFQEHYQQGKTGVEFIHLMHKDGHSIPAEMRSSVIEIEGQELVQGIFRDISQRLQSEAQMELQSTALNAAANGIMITDTQGQIIWVNPAFSTLTGYSPAEIIGQTPNLLNAKVHPPEFFQNLWEAITSGKVWKGQITNCRKDGQKYIDEQTITPMFDSTGQITHYIAIKQDITERIQAEENLKRKLSETSLLQQISMTGATLTDEDVLIETITKVISSSFYSDHMGVLLLDETQSYLYPHTSYIGIKQADFSKRVKLGEGVSGKVVEKGEPILISDVSTFSEYISTLSDLRSEICVPLVVSDKVIGVINVESKQLDAFTQEDLQLLTTISSQLATAIERARLYKELIQSNKELSIAYDRTLEGWASALELRDHETQGHTERVTELAVKMAVEAGLQEPELTQLRRGSLLHDIGKIGIPDAILFKPGPLNDREIDVMQRHPVYAKNLLARIPFLKSALDIPHYHHEKWDGTGYPARLKGAQIPLAARIFAIVDVWDALISSRPYRAAWGKQEAMDYIVSQSGKYFDPQLVKLFTKLVRLE